MKELNIEDAKKVNGGALPLAILGFNAGVAFYLAIR
ncbi:hypothetical protein VIVU109783_06260 [Vibrio vulnificus]